MGAVFTPSPCVTVTEQLHRGVVRSVCHAVDNPPVCDHVTSSQKGGGDVWRCPRCSGVKMLFCYLFPLRTRVEEVVWLYVPEGLQSEGGGSQVPHDGILEFLFYFLLLLFYVYDFMSNVFIIKCYSLTLSMLKPRWWFYHNVIFRLHVSEVLVFKLLYFYEHRLNSTNEVSALIQNLVFEKHVCKVFQTFHPILDHTKYRNNPNPKSQMTMIRFEPQNTS